MMRGMMPQFQRRIGPAVAAAGMLLLAAPAMAQVYQVEDGGTVRVRRGGGEVNWQDTSAVPAKVQVRRPVVRVATYAMASRAVPGVAGQTALAPVGAQGDPRQMLNQAAAQAGLHPALLEALVWQESRWNPAAVSRKGAVGLTQLMPATARDLGVDPRDPAANLFAGARHLRSLLDRFNGDVVKALAAYNAGARRVEEWNGVPPIRETQDYVARILSRLGTTLTRP